MIKLAIIDTVLIATLASAFNPYYGYNTIQYNAPLPLQRINPYIYPPTEIHYPTKHHVHHEIKKAHALVSPLPGVVVPSVAAAATGVAVTKVGIVAKIAGFALSAAKAFVLFFLTHGLALVIGSLAALGVCKFTPICDKSNSIKSIVDLQRDLTYYATPERITAATEFVQNAIREYRSLQN